MQLTGALTGLEAVTRKKKGRRVEEGRLVMVQVSGSLANKGPAACQDPRKYPEELDRDATLLPEFS